MYIIWMFGHFVFFFQAEDGIRDYKVTGVQTCALPIYLLWGERQIRSVANMTRADARDFLKIAAEIKLQPKVTKFPLHQANEALLAIKNDSIDGAAVIIP